MQDIETIKETYSSMPDELLINFAVQERQQLTIEAKNVLFEELNKRNLVLPDGIDTSEIAFIDRSVWLFALEQKESGKPNELIFGELIERGTSEPDARHILGNLAVHLKKNAACV